MNIHTDIKKDGQKERTYQIEVTVPKTSTPIVVGEAANQKVGEVMKYLENVILNHEWIEEVGYEEKIEVLRQYSLYWFLNNIVQVDMYPLPEEGVEGAEQEGCGK